MELTKDEIILKALKEYEENHYATESQVWQKKINALIDKWTTKLNKIGVKNEIKN